MAGTAGSGGCAARPVRARAPEGMGRAVVCRPRRKRKRGLRLVADRVRAATHRRSSGCTSARTARTRTGTVHARVRDPGARRAQGRGRYTDSGAAAGPGAAEPDARDRGGARACANWRVRRRRPTHDAADGAGPRSQRAPGGGHGTRGAAGARVVAVGAGHADRRLAVAPRRRAACRGGDRSGRLRPRAVGTGSGPPLVGPRGAGRRAGVISSGHRDRAAASDAR